MIKNPSEISNIEKACKLTDKAFNYILNKIRQGISEKELAFKIEFFIKKNGADIAFPSIVAFGKNSAFPHHVPTNNSKLITHNSIILLDFGAKVDNYCSDMTRTVFFGKPTTEQKLMHQTVLEAQKQAIDYLKSSIINHKSISAKDVDETSRKYIISKGYRTIPHSVGHGIGLEVHEPPHLSPKSKDILKPGMVFTIEPGIYIKGSGGVRIEDVIVLKNNGLSFLSKSSRELITL